MREWDQFGQDYDHPLFEGNPRLYLIASTPRCGSHYLGHLLLQTGSLGSPLEYFNSPHLRKWQEQFGTPNFASTMAALYRRRTSPSGWFGVKAHWDQFEPIAQHESLRSFLNIETYIEIIRRDRIAQAISLAIAQQTQAFISFHRAQGEPHYDFTTIRRMVEALDRHVGLWRSFFATAGITPLTVDYEDLTSNPEAAIERIMAHFGVTRVNAGPRWQPERQTSDLNARWQERYLADLATLTD